ncbi:MAG: heavy metal translocating P-type ATPase [Clostridia bacterium]
MVVGVKKELLLEGLNCANCAVKIEARVKALEGISSASINFATKTLVVEMEDKQLVEPILQETIKIIKDLEPHVDVREKDKMPKISDAHKDHGTEKDGRSPFFEGEWLKENRAKALQLTVGVLLFGAVLVLKLPFWMELSLYFISYFLVGGEVLVRAVQNIIKGQVFDENFLMALATVGAFAIGEYPEGVAVMLFYQIGEVLQDIAVNRSRRSIIALMDIRPDYANRKVNGDIQIVSPEELSIGDMIVVKPGEKVPLDGIVLEGKSMLDMSPLTGESLPREVEKGDEVLSGSINQNGVLTVQVTKSFGESTVSRILDLVENAGARKAPVENFITKFARYYTPVVVFAALAVALIPPLIIPGASFSQWVYRALVFLVISCPCALVISIPLSFFGGIGAASRNGILVKGSNYLDALNEIDTVVFDKTGTLTKGVFEVAEIHPRNGYSKDELLEYAAYAESGSNHPIALSVSKAYGREVDREVIRDVEEMPGLGMKVHVGEREILAGNGKLMDIAQVAYDRTETGGTVIHVAVDGLYAGFITISDEVKEDALQGIRSLKRLGIPRTVMLTGDNNVVAQKVARQLELDQVFAELMPDQKVEKLEMMDRGKSSRGKLVFVGDGINDAPVLARVDIGVAMGGLGSDAAIEAADIVLMTDEPTKLAAAIRIAKRTRRVAWQNIIFALGVKGFVLLLGAGGLTSMWEAVFADVGVALIAVLNAIRVTKTNT